MNELNQIARRLQGKILKDIIVGGYIDRVDHLIHFHPMFDDVYFDLNGILLKVSSVSHFWSLKLELAENIKFRYELEDDDEFCVSSLDWFLKFQLESNYLNKIHIFTATPSDNEIICAALSFKCKNAHLSSNIILLDPSTNFGIRLGDEKEFSEWKTMNSNAREIILPK